MRIAQLTNFVGPASGGIKTALAALGTGYVNAGANRLLIVPGARDAQWETADGDIVQLRGPRVGGGYRVIAEPWRVLEVLEKFAPTSVEVNDKSTLLPVGGWARRNRVGSLLFSHERLDKMLAMRTRLETGVKAPVAFWNKTLARRFDTIVVTSSFARAELQSSADAAGCALVQIPLGVDLETFAPADAESPSGYGPREDSAAPLRLVHVGRLSREKSPQLAVATAVTLHRRGVRVQLDVYGQGPQLAELQAMAANAPVRFHGYLPDRTELATRLRRADIALSVCPGETFGLAVLEALACGTPVVTSSCGGARELICSESGAWARPDSDALADAVTQLASRPIEHRRQAARTQALRFPWENTIAQMLTVHSQLARHHLHSASA